MNNDAMLKQKTDLPPYLSVNDIIKPVNDKG